MSEIFDECATSHLSPRVKLWRFEASMPGPRENPDRAHRLGVSLAEDIAMALHRCGTADKNRVLLALAAFIGAQLEALEANNDTEPE
jgi:hypothetical protein